MDNPAAHLPAIEAWLAQMDRGDYAQSWESASSAFRTAVSQKRWTEMSTPVRTPLGVVVTRTLHALRATPVVAGGAGGEYLVAEFNTAFAADAEMAEIVTFVLDKDAQWKAWSYLIVPRTAADRQALAAAQAWLGGIDAGRYAQSYDDASAFFRDALSREKWVAALEQVRRPLGQVRFRVAEMTEAKKIQGLDSIILQFSTSFEADSTTIETVTFSREAPGGEWRASGYFIK